MLVLRGPAYTRVNWALALAWSGFGIISGIGLVTPIPLLQAPHRVAE